MGLYSADRKVGSLSCAGVLHSLEGFIATPPTHTHTCARVRACVCFSFLNPLLFLQHFLMAATMQLSLKSHKNMTKTAQDHCGFGFLGEAAKNAFSLFFSSHFLLSQSSSVWVTSQNITGCGVFPEVYFPAALEDGRSR